MLKGVPAVALVGGEIQAMLDAVAAATEIELSIALVMEPLLASETVSVCVPEVFSVTPFVNVCTPASPPL
jgi:hypothetical protein